MGGVQLTNQVLTIRWREFKIAELFAVCLANGDLQEPKLEEGEYPLISSGKTNNGICKYIAFQNKSTLFKGGAITVDMFGKVFFQKNDFYAVGHGRVNILVPKFVSPTYVSLYIAAVMDTSFKKKYSFNNMANKKAIGNEMIFLPVLSNGDLDYEYMKNYMRCLREKNRSRLNVMQILENA